MSTTSLPPFNTSSEIMNLPILTVEESKTHIFDSPAQFLAYMFKNSSGIIYEKYTTDGADENPFASSSI
jgi:hypothetical protein